MIGTCFYLPLQCLLIGPDDWTVFATENILVLGDDDYSRHRMTAGFAFLPQWWSVDRSVQNLTHSLQFCLAQANDWVAEVWWRKLRQHHLDGSVPGVWRRLGGVTCSDSEQFRIPYKVPLNHRHTTDHGQVTFIFSCVSLFGCFLSAFRTLEVLDDHACGWHETKSVN